VVVVVTDTIFVKDWRSGGLNPPDEAFLGQHAQCVVYRLSRDATDLGANILGDVIRLAMRAPRDRPKHRQALSRDLDTVFAKDFLSIVTHAGIIGKIWTLSIIRFIPAH